MHANTMMISISPTSKATAMMVGKLSSSSSSSSSSSPFSITSVPLVFSVDDDSLPTSTKNNVSH